LAAHLSGKGNKGEVIMPVCGKHPDVRLERINFRSGFSYLKCPVPNCKFVRSDKYAKGSQRAKIVIQTKKQTTEQNGFNEIPD
jgi:hypothetical protein